MTTLPDLLYVALFAVALPLWDYLVAWPALKRQLQADPARARKRLWISAIWSPWALVAIGAVLWMANDRPWSLLGLTAPVGWRLWVAAGIVGLLLIYYIHGTVAVARDPAARASVQKQLTGELANVLPRTRAELNWPSSTRYGQRSSCTRSLTLAAA